MGEGDDLLLGDGDRSPSAGTPLTREEVEWPLTQAGTQALNTICWKWNSGMTLALNSQDNCLRCKCNFNVVHSPYL
jgi:hypothetical protein